MFFFFPNFCYYRRERESLVPGDGIDGYLHWCRANSKSPSKKSFENWSLKLGKPGGKTTMRVSLIPVDN